ncbi:MAG: Gfo/Idh/MocA family oxidoreductase [Acidobacteriota bacterium]
MRIRVGVIGVGSLGRHHARILAGLEGVELVGVADSRLERAETVADAHGCEAFGDYRKLLERVEAVTLAVPTEDHVEVGLVALERGIHLLVEKPIASELEGADRLIETAARKSRVLQVGHVERFNPVLQAVLPHLKRPQFFEAHRLGVFVPRSLDVDVVLDLMIHDLDLVLWLTGREIRDIRAVGIPVLTPRVDIANARIEFDDGCVANLTASRVSRERVRKLRFFQAHDYVSLDFHGKTLEMYSLEERDGVREIIERTPDITPVEPLEAELAAFMSEICGGKPSSACSGEAGRAALAVALEVVEQSKRSLTRRGF